MKSLVFHGHRDVRVDDVPDPQIQQPGDAVLRVERTAICGSDLHAYHAAGPAASPFALGHEFLGTVEDVGSDVQRVRKGDRVLVACTVGCGHCSLCRDDLYSGCQTTTTMGPLSNILGTPLLPGGQAEGARIPFADTNCLPIPDGLDDEQVLFLTDILPTGYMGADLAEVGPGDVCVVFGCGPVGTFAQIAAQLRGAACVVAVDLDDGRLEKARARGCRPLNPTREDLDGVVRELTDGRGADCAIEAVGKVELALRAIDVARPGGRVSIVGIIVSNELPIPILTGVLGKNLTLRAGTVNPQFYYPELIRLIQQGRIRPEEIITHRLPLADAPRGYEIFDAHKDSNEEDVLKVVLQP
ncbi:MAG: alcohol dehydrogenase catalytic domain-containing protein [Myxococcota bacterium]|nr:alcohol dehydrogenase catalytic domain-containing protein [Myxococcota bacterium]